MTIEQSFKQLQLQHTRVSDAYREKEFTVKKYFLNKNLNYKGHYLLLRAFKSEQILEIWVKQDAISQYQLLTQYPFCLGSGALGPKRKEGDRQIPEGVYYINHFNPLSKFHLSLGINYPNKSDLLLCNKESPGSEIYIHGGCVTVGCIPLTDDKIKELYILAVEARNNGQSKIPVHIFPTRLSQENLQALEVQYVHDQQTLMFWQNLQMIYLSFERTRVLREISINDNGEYYF